MVLLPRFFLALFLDKSAKARYLKNMANKYEIKAFFWQSGNRADCSTPEVLGEFCGKLLSAEEALHAAAELQDGVESAGLHLSTTYYIQGAK